jgi:hypothetical protein
VDLRPTGDPGLDLEAATLTRRVPLDLVAKGRPRADDAHVAADDVPELRQLVDREAAENPAGGGDPGVAVVDGVACAQLLRPHHHRPQLEQLELLAVLSDALLPVEDWPAVLELDRERPGSQERAGQHQTGRGQGDVRGAIHDRRA